MAEFEWPDDPEFRRVAARIADAVTVAINSGVRIGPNDQRRGGCRCPLGCLDLNDSNTHPIGAAARILGIDWDDAEQFAGWFDHGCALSPSPREPYGHLGLAYRERFVR